MQNSLPAHECVGVLVNLLVKAGFAHQKQTPFDQHIYECDFTTRMKIWY